MSKRCDWVGFCASVFLSFREQGAMLEYLRFQESVDNVTDGEDPLRVVGHVLDVETRQLGKSTRPLVAVVVHSGDGVRRRVRVPLDPFRTFRRVYARLLLVRRGRSIGGWKLLNRIDLFWARLQIWLLRRAGLWMWRRGVVPRMTGDTAAELRELFGNAPGHPESPLNASDIALLTRGLERFALEEAWPLLERTSEAAWLTGGAGKFTKLLIGTFLGHAAAAKERCQGGHDTILVAARASFYWALTYPLVDDVLDGGQYSAKDRERLEDALRSVLHADCEALPPGTPPIAIAIDRLLRLPGIDRARSAAAIDAVLTAHVEGAKQRLGEPASDGDSSVHNALEKSLLVRIATSELCGFRVPWEDYRKMAAVAYFNQLGDDIWDAAEDVEHGNITPVTSWLTGFREENPYQEYVDFGAWLAEQAGSSAVARAATLAMVHTFSLAVAAGSTSVSGLGCDILGKGFDVGLLRCVPHIDPDSLLFDLERLAVAEYRRSTG